MLASKAEPASRFLSLRETAALVLSLFFVGVSFGGTSPLISSILESRGRSEYFTGGVVAMLSLGLALFSPVAGRLVDRLGARRVNVSGIVLQGFGFAALGASLALDDRWLFAARLWLGLAAACTFVAAEFALLRGTPERYRGRIMAVYGAGFGLGFMLGVFVSASVFARFGLASFPALGLLAFAIAPLAHWGLRGTSPPSGRNPATSPAGPASLPYASLLVALYGALVYAVLDIAMTGTYPVEGMRLGLTRSEALRLVGWMAAGTVLVQPAVGWMADRFGNRRLLVWLVLTGLLASLASGAASTRYLPAMLWPATIGFTLVGCSAGGIFPVSLALLGERTPTALLSRANAAFSAVFGYASLVAPILAAGFIDAAETVGLLGWAVPALAASTFAAGLPLVWADRKWLAVRKAKTLR